jgi:hypothetical protein
MKKRLTVTLCMILTFAMLGITVLAGVYVEDPNTPNTFAAEEGDDAIGFNFKDGGGAWANIMNPWGTSAFMVTIPGEGYVQSLIVTLKIEGYDGGADGYRLMGGFGINGWSPSVWSLDADGEDNANWEEIYGERFYYFIDKDGYYQFIFDFRGAMDWFEGENDWYIKDYLEGIDCIELGIFSPPEDTTMRLTIIGIEDTADIFSLESVSRPLGSDKLFATDLDSLPPLPAPEPPREPRIDDNDNPQIDPVAPIETLPPDETDPGDTDPGDTPNVTDPGDTTGDATGDATANTADNATDDKDDGFPWWGWVLIAVGVAGVAVVILIAVKKKG